MSMVINADDIRSLYQIVVESPGNKTVRLLRHSIHLPLVGSSPGEEGEKLTSNYRGKGEIGREAIYFIDSHKISFISRRKMGKS